MKELSALDTLDMEQKLINKLHRDVIATHIFFLHVTVLINNFYPDLLEFRTSKHLDLLKQCKDAKAKY
jgi:hypothetical protein